MRLSLAKKMFGGFAIVFLLLVLASLYISSEMDEYNEDLKNSSIIQERLVLSQKLQYSVSAIQQFFTDASLTKDETVISDEVDPIYDDARNYIKQLISLHKEPDLVKALNEIQNHLKSLYSSGNKMFSAYNRDWDLGNREMDNFDETSSELITDLEDFVHLETVGSRETTEEMIQMSYDLKSTSLYTVIFFLC